MSDLLDVLERLEAGRAAVERLAGRRAELRRQLGVGRAAARAGERPAGGLAATAAIGPSCERRRPGRGDAVLGERCASAGGDPVARPGRVQADPHLDVGEACVAQPVHQVVAHRGHRGAAGVGRRDRHDDPCRRRRSTSRSTPRSSSVSIGISGSVTDAATSRALAQERSCHASPLPHRVRPGHGLHLGEQPAERLGVQPVAAGLAAYARQRRRPPGGRRRSSRTPARAARRPRRATVAGSTPTPDPAAASSTAWVVEQLGAQRPDRLEPGHAGGGATPRCPAPA